MREDVKQKHFATPLRETSIGTCIQAPSLRGEAFGSNAWSGHRVRQGYGSQLLISTWAVSSSGPDPIRCEAAQAKRWLKCQPSSYVRLEAYGFFGLSEGGIGLTRSLGADGSTRNA